MSGHVGRNKMMKIWKDTDSEDQFTDATVVNLSSLQPFKLTMCDRFGSDFPGLELTIESKGVPNDYIKSGPLFIASERLKGVFEKFDVKMEVFPVVMRQNNYLVDGQYYYLHFLEEVDCIDKSKSEFTLDENYIDEIDKLVIDTDRLEGTNFVKVANCIDFILIASSEMVDEVLGSGITGVRFVDPEDWVC
jgi:hypothetical protein